jgi:hypothetical protein
LLFPLLARSSAHLPEPPLPAAPFFARAAGCPVGIQVPPINNPTLRRGEERCVSSQCRGIRIRPWTNWWRRCRRSRRGPTACGLAPDAGLANNSVAEHPFFPSGGEAISPPATCLTPPASQWRDRVIIGRMQVTDHVRGNVAAGATMWLRRPLPPFAATPDIVRKMHGRVGDWRLSSTFVTAVVE